MKNSNKPTRNQDYFTKLIINLLSSMDNSLMDSLFLLAVVQESELSGGEWCKDIKTIIKNVSDEESEYGIAAALKKNLSRKDITQFIKILKKEYPICKEENIPLSSTSSASVLLELSPTEEKILDLAVRGREVGYSTTSLFHNIEYKFSNIVETYSSMLGISKTDVSAALEGILFQGGILVKDNSDIKGLYGVSDDISPLFTYNSLSLDDLDKILFPNMIKSTLSMKDYKHLKDESLRCEKLINNNISARKKNKSAPSTNIMFWGEAGCGKTELAIAMAKKNKWDIKVIGDISPQNMTEKSRMARLASLKMATKIFKNKPNVVLLFDEIEDLFKEDAHATFSKAFINRIIETSEVPIIWTSNSLYGLGQPVLRRMLYNIQFSIPNDEIRKNIWKKYAKDVGLNISKKSIDFVSVNYSLSPALIRNAANVAKSAFDNKKVSDDELIEIVGSLHTLINYGEYTKVKKKDSTEFPYDLSCVNTESDLEVLTSQLVNAKDAGFSLCLYGAPGTGKSEFGKYIAKKMNKKILLKRASDLQSPWVGVCEKNIAEAFAEASATNKILLIDEGDSFLYDRKKSKASWEISQVNEMLSQMESTDHPFILTTNLMRDIDEAALRRFTFKMEFSYMSGDQSVRLFKKFFGAKPDTRIRKNPMLAPGDFANVKRQCDILNITDASVIADMLIAETKLKSTRKSKIGF